MLSYEEHSVHSYLESLDDIILHCGSDLRWQVLSIPQSENVRSTYKPVVEEVVVVYIV